MAKLVVSKYYSRPAFINQEVSHLNHRTWKIIGMTVSSILPWMVLD